MFEANGKDGFWLMAKILFFAICYYSADDTYGVWLMAKNFPSAEEKLMAK